MQFTEIISFLIASIILALSPGPDNIFVLVTALGEGFKTALKFVFGLACGIILHTFFIVLGLSTFLKQSPYGLLVLKIFAISYLLYLAYMTYIHRKERIKLTLHLKSPNYFKRGFLMNISNPKVLLFFLAFFPQFARMQDAGYQGRILILGGLFILVTLVVFSTIAWLGAKGGEKFMKNTSYTLIINWLAIIVFVGISLILLINPLSING